MSAATPSSTARVDAAEGSLLICSSPPPRSAPRPSARGVSRAPAMLPCEEPRFFHEQDVPRFLARHPSFIVLPVQRRLVERPLLEKLLPLGGFPHFLQKVH